ncbi:hypothetical protein D9M69_567480 [compost metagenome]
MVKGVPSAAYSVRSSGVSARRPSKRRRAYGWTCTLAPSTGTSVSSARSSTANSARPILTMMASPVSAITLPSNGFGSMWKPHVETFGFPSKMLNLKERTLRGT